MALILSTAIQNYYTTINSLVVHNQSGIRVHFIFQDGHQILHHQISITRALLHSWAFVCFMYF